MGLLDMFSILTLTSSAWNEISLSGRAESGEGASSWW